jgi:hypothetical protein
MVVAGAFALGGVVAAPSTADAKVDDPYYRFVPVDASRKMPRGLRDAIHDIHRKSRKAGRRKR